MWWKGSGPTETTRSLCLDIVLLDGCLVAALAAVLLLSFISLHGIFSIPTTVKEGEKFLSAFRLPFIPTKKSMREGHALPPSLPSSSYLAVGSRGSSPVYFR